MYFFYYILNIMYWLLMIDVYVSHLVSSAGSVISSKSPSPAFRWSGIQYTEP